MQALIDFLTKFEPMMQWLRDYWTVVGLGGVLGSAGLVYKEVRYVIHRGKSVSKQDEILYWNKMSAEGIHILVQTQYRNLKGKGTEDHKKFLDKYSDESISKEE